MNPKKLISINLPLWWDLIPASFQKRCDLLNIREWELSESVRNLRKIYEARFGADKIQARIPMVNWQRADFCSHLVSREQPESIADIGSGLGEFVNLFAKSNSHSKITSIDIKDYDLWFNESGAVERIHSSLFDLDRSMKWDIVTCFEVIEHLQPDTLEKSVEVLRSLARKKLFVSIPFMEPLPLYRGHFSRFDEFLLNKLFPDGKFTIFNKGSKSKDKVMAWILCEIQIS